MERNLLFKPNDYFNQYRREMLPYIPEHAKIILEVGCAEGLFGAALKHKIKEVWGVEYDPKQSMKAQNRLDKVFTGDIAEVMMFLPDHYFDCIVCNDVLEHLIDPYTILDSLKQKLTSEGVIVSSIPNIRYFRNLYDFVINKNWDYTDSGIMDKTHYRFFTVKSIRKMYENLGYKIIKHEGINPSRSIRPLLWNIITLNAFWDIKFCQFATVAQPIKR